MNQPQHPQAAAKPWPVIREDLTLYPAPPSADGAPMWTLHDPARNAYFQIDWVSFEVITRLSLGNAEALADAINQETTLHVSESDIETVLTFLGDNELLVRVGDEEIAWLYKRAGARKHSWFQQMIHGYLFFRIPVFKPDRMLEWLLPKLKFLFGRRFLEITALVLLFGLWQVYRQWPLFSSTLMDTFSLEGILGYAGALIAVKIVHEFGHALVAKRCGCRVPTMGVAFLVMWPMAYTDVTESWKLDSHRKRLMIAGAGIATELVIAAWAIWLWSILPDGPARSACFFLGTTSIVATLAINASPFMRFDGYFLLCDVLGTPNLHSRAFAYTRWWLREQLFRLGDAPPEVLSPERRRFFILFALGTWLYRLIVFTGIAVMVYHYFFKVLGIALFIVEIWYFLLRPVVQELLQWRKRWDEIGPVVRHRPAFYVLSGLALILVLPLDLTVNTQGMLKPEQSFSVVTPLPAMVTNLPPVPGSRVAVGDLLVGLESPELDKRMKQTLARIEPLSKQVSGSGFDNQLRHQQPILRAQLASNQQALDGVKKEQERLMPHAPFAGVIADVEPDLFVGEWLPKGTTLVTLIDDKQWVVDCYVDEADLKRLDKGNWGRFIPDGPGRMGVGLSVMSIDRDASRVLTEGALASVAGGEILVRTQEKKLVPEHAVYRVRLKADGWLPGGAEGYLRGRVVILAWPKSVLGDFLRGALATLVREAGF